jgi:hypothetical protein
MEKKKAEQSAKIGKEELKAAQRSSTLQGCSCIL